MLKIGLTGNAGSGKSTAVDFFRSKGIDGISADAINLNLRNHCQFLTKLLENILQTRLSDKNGLLDAGLLRQIIFSSTSSQETIESVLHPLIIENIDLQLALLPDKHYCIIEIPLLYEADLISYVDSVLLVTADRKTLINRIKSRNHLTQQDAESILDKQLADNSKFPPSNDIVLNNDTQEVFQSHLNLLHHRNS